MLFMLCRAFCSAHLPLLFSRSVRLRVLSRILVSSMDHIEGISFGLVQRSGAAFFNLSMLTSDMWAVAIRIFIYKQKVTVFTIFILQMECSDFAMNYYLHKSKLFAFVK